MNSTIKSLVEDPSETFQWVLLTLFLTTFFGYLWRRRWLYYHSVILPGPFSLPIMGSPSIVFSGQKDIFKNFLETNEKYPLVWRLWVGSDLYISTSSPKDIEYILNNCLQKENILFYRYIDEDCSSILTTTFNRWKSHRRNINPCFNQRMLNYFFPIMVKHTDKMVTRLDQPGVEILPVSTRSMTLNIILETLGGVNPETLVFDSKGILEVIVRYEELIVERIVNVLYSIDFFWRLSSERKELMVMVNQIKNRVKETIQLFQKLETTPGLRHFINCLEKGDYTDGQFLEEVTFMYAAGSETSAITICMVLLTMSIYPDIQEKLYQEQLDILPENEEITLEDLNKLDYLDRVIKETLRIVPPTPIIARYIDKTVSGSRVYPEGSMVLIPIVCIHRNPEFWSDPMRFDPDRFLPEEVRKRPKGVYLPFSHGSRNCIGMKFGMNSVKLALLQIVRNFEIESGKYKSLGEVEMVFHIVAKPKDGFNIRFKKRVNKEF